MLVEGVDGTRVDSGIWKQNGKLVDVESIKIRQLLLEALVIYFIFGISSPSRRKRMKSWITFTSMTRPRFNFQKSQIKPTKSQIKSAL